MGEPHDLHVDVVGEGSIGVVELVPGFKEKYPTLASLRMLIVSELKHDFSAGFVFQRKGRDVALAAERKAPIAHCLQKTGDREYLVTIRRGAEDDSDASSRHSGSLGRNRTKPREQTNPVSVDESGPVYLMSDVNVFKKRLIRLEEKHYLCAYSYTREAAAGDVGPTISRIDLRYAKELSPPETAYSNAPDGYYQVQLKIQRRDRQVGVPSDDPHYDLLVMAIKHTESLTMWLAAFHRVCRFPAIRYEIDPSAKAWQLPKPSDEESTSSSIPPGMFDVYKATFQSGPLGMSVANFGKSAAIDRVVTNSQADRNGVGVGDVVLKVGTKVVQGMSWEKVLDLLVKSPRPIQVTFGKKALVSPVTNSPPMPNTGYSSFAGIGGSRLSTVSVMTENDTMQSQGSTYQRKMAAIAGSVEQSLQRQISAIQSNSPELASPPGLNRKRAETNQTGADQGSRGPLARAIFKLKDQASQSLYSPLTVGRRRKLFGKKKSDQTEGSEQDITQTFFGEVKPKKATRRPTQKTSVSESEISTSTHSSFDKFEKVAKKTPGQSKGATPMAQSPVVAASKALEVATKDSQLGSMTLEQVKTAIDKKSSPVTLKNFETYLSDEDFEKAFRMPRYLYEKLPPYKRTQKKKAVKFG